MTIDERLEKLAERTDAIAHSVELLAAMQIETEKRMSRLAERCGETESRMARLASDYSASETRLSNSMATFADGMAQLTRVVIGHDERLDRLEGGHPH